MKELKKREVALWFIIAALCVATGNLLAKHGDPLPAHAEAAVRSDYPGQIANGDVAVHFDAGTKVPATCNTNRNAIALYNNGAEYIYCGAQGVTQATGFPIPNATMLAVDVQCNADRSASLYCVSATVDQSGASDTRWIEVK